MMFFYAFSCVDSLMFLAQEPAWQSSEFTLFRSILAKFCEMWYKKETRLSHEEELG